MVVTAAFTTAPPHHRTTAPPRARFLTIRRWTFHSREHVAKRSDEIAMEPPATDKKTRTDDEHIHEEDKQRLHETRGKLSIPKRGENPALRALKAKRRGRKTEG